MEAAAKPTFDVGVEARLPPMTPPNPMPPEKGGKWRGVNR